MLYLFVWMVGDERQDQPSWDEPAAAEVLPTSLLRRDGAMIQMMTTSNIPLNDIVWMAGFLVDHGR